MPPTAPQLFGLHELYRPATSVPEIDIVAVHGLNGDRHRTWTTQSKSSPVCWLDHPDFLPRYLPFARVLTWGYNANVSSLGSKIASSERLLLHAQTLISQLYANRDLDDASERPLIFVCHSLGGIVVKKALTYSESTSGSQFPNLRSIYICTFALLFLGTPHHGSTKARLLHTMTKLVSVTIPTAALKVSTNLLKTLEYESEVLQEVTAAFVPIMSRFRVYFFWEEHKTNIKYTRDFIVEESSAAPIIDNTERCGIAADHREMCRFEKNDDSGFRVVIEALMRYSREASDVIKVRCQEAREIDQNERDARERDLGSLSGSGGLTTARKEDGDEVSERRTSFVLKPPWQE